MIHVEKTVIDYLANLVPAYGEVPDELPTDMRFIVVEKTGESRENTIYRSTVVVQSYGRTLVEAMMLDGEIVDAMLGGLTELPEISRCQLNSNYPWTDTATKRYRFQAVFDIVHY